MGIEDRLDYPKEHPQKECKCCTYARRCLASNLGKICIDFSKKYNNEQEYDKKEKESMRENSQ